MDCSQGQSPQQTLLPLLANTLLKTCGKNLSEVHILIDFQWNYIPTNALWVDNGVNRKYINIPGLPQTLTQQYRG